MKVKIVSKEQNPLLKRSEVAFSIEHDKDGGTPTRGEVRNQLAQMLKIDLELVYIKHLETKTGTSVAVGEANAYESVEQAKLVEPEHLIARNLPKKKPKEESEEAEEAETEEEPAEEKPAEDTAEKTEEKAENEEES
jgi:small subunit ribosomal protein S24e